ncbi:MAG: hypothetical protein OEY25_09540 [Candidatus Aminicenantes bacterium]|nr:hypothetical protein [Candidatus Aminicenantes bacterium]
MLTQPAQLKRNFLFPGESATAAIRYQGNGCRYFYLLWTLELTGHDDSALPEDGIECPRRKK